MALTRSQEQENLRAIRRKVEEIRWFLDPLSAENVGAPDPVEYPAPFRISHIIGELSVVEEGLRDATQDPDHWFNMLVSDPKDWTHPWHEDDRPSLRESSGLSSARFDTKLSLTFVCKNCGANPAILNLPDNHTEDSIAVCKKCRFPFGTVGDIRADVVSHVGREILSKGKGISLVFYEEE